MKELVKPDVVEGNYGEISFLDENRCRGGMTCNKVCDSRNGSTNESIGEETDILF